jgi:ATPase subunit of ABC transporter with duplicated ATPase domains
MLIDAIKLSKSVGAKYLFQDISFSIMPGEKVALIGRNGNGKTTLLQMLSNEDHDYEGEIITQKGIEIILTKQEHIENTTQSPVEYIINSIPNYHKYKKILENFESGKNTNVNNYLETLEKFTEYKFFNLEDAVLSTLADFNIPNELAGQPLSNLSGGQKRYMEMTKMMFSQADLLLIDEPTNHLDYLGKERFISWMRNLKKTLVVVTHDRDVLKYVDKIIEIKDKRFETYKGNYDHYIKLNSSNTLSSVKDYTSQLNKLKEAKKKVQWGLQMRAKSKQWKTRYDHWLRDYEKLKAETVKPSFWIDQDSVEDLDKKVVDSYDKFKEKNITIKMISKRERGIERILVRNLSLGYEQAVFKNLNFSLKDNDRVYIKGKNGAGKSTLVKTILSLADSIKPVATILDGKISLSNDLRIGEYQQEIDKKYLKLTLAGAIRLSYEEKDIPVTEEQIMSLLSQYLFNPMQDAHQRIVNLSGGQKARFQIIRMLINEPNLLILDEPTNHLDLPSIEELENALAKFNGAILYISHDTYFIKKMGGTVVKL